MKKKTTNDVKFYITLLMGFSLLVTGLFLPPIGTIDPSVLQGAGMLFILAAVIIGADVPAILHEIRLMRKGVIEDLKPEKEQEQEKEDN